MVNNHHVGSCVCKWIVGGVLVRKQENWALRYEYDGCAGEFICVCVLFAFVYFFT